MVMIGGEEVVIPPLPPMPSRMLRARHLWGGHFGIVLGGFATLYSVPLQRPY